MDDIIRRFLFRDEAVGELSILKNEDKSFQMSFPERKPGRIDRVIVSGRAVQYLEGTISIPI